MSSFSGNSGKERMKSGYRNRMLEKGLQYLMHISVEGSMPGVYNYRLTANLFLLKLTRTNNSLVKGPQKTAVLTENYIPSDNKETIICSAPLCETPLSLAIFVNYQEMTGL